MPNEKKLKLTLVKSLIGRLEKHRATVQVLGLKKIHQSVLVDDIPSVRGMINSVNYLLKVEECV